MISYDTLFSVGPKDNDDTGPSFMIGKGYSDAMISMDADSFKIEYLNGKAHIMLARRINAKECRDLASALTIAADGIEDNKSLDYVHRLTEKGQSLTVKVTNNNE